MKNLFIKYLKQNIILVSSCIIMIITLSSCIFSKFGPVKCDFKDPKEISLCEINNKLNDALSHKDWEAVYSLKLDAKNNGIGDVEIKKEFIKQYERVSAGGVLNYKMISLEINGDNAETTNHVETRVFFWPFKAYPDTAIHYWKYSKDKWFLYDLDRRPKWE